jgi:hypothetical protein
MPCRWRGLKAHQERGHTDRRLAVTGPLRPVRIRRKGRREGKDFRRINRGPEPYRLAGGVEADPGLVGQPGDSFGPEHTWELAKHAG